MVENYNEMCHEPIKNIPKETWMIDLKELMIDNNEDITENFKWKKQEYKIWNFKKKILEVKK